MPLCPTGTEPKAGTPTFIILGTSLIAALISKRLPPAAPFVGALESLLLDTGILCNGDPPDWPTFVATDFTDLARGLPNARMTQAVMNAAWYVFCQCADAATPVAPLAPPVADIPSWPPGEVLPCASIHVDFSPDADNLSGTYNVIGTPTAPRGIPVGATSVRISPIGIDHGTGTRQFTSYIFRATFKNAAGQALNSPIAVAEWENGHWNNDQLLFALTAGTSQFYVEVYPNIAATGPFNTGAVVTADYDFYCAPPDLLQPECCPPDPTLIAKLNRLEASLTQVLALLAPPGTLAELGSIPISGEGTVQLLPGTRQVNVQLAALGANTKMVPYANPDRIMRAGTIRFGNDFGWKRREHVDNTDCLFPVPPDAVVVSWSLSPGTTGTLVQLGTADATLETRSGQ